MAISSIVVDQLSYVCLVVPLVLYSCFISDIGVFFGLFLGPILALVLVNFIIFVFVIRVLVKHSIRKSGDLDKKKQAKATFKTLLSVVSIMFLFGLQWIFGAFTIAEASTVFQWFFVIFSTLQGFFLFVFFCILSHDAREEWLNLFLVCLRKKRQRSVITSKLSQSTLRDKKSGSTLPQRGRVISPVSSESMIEMCSRRSLLMAPPITSISEEQDTEFIITNSNTTDHGTLSDETASIEKVDLATMDVEDVKSKPPSVEVPEHILHRRVRLQHNPAVTASLPLDTKPETKNKDTNVNHGSISIVEYADHTRTTDLSRLINDGN